MKPSRDSFLYSLMFIIIFLYKLLNKALCFFFYFVHSDLIFKKNKNLNAVIAKLSYLNEKKL
jgi:hypothetical protein